ncbi:hypothetical protein WCE00_13840 [Acinetobacter haemolyticus]|uniref:hypothetical protein n=1 Tax=Acinetobacter haemolyticus TaxID=29430 RepID=UPI000F748C4C|nr:hypothetical protein [Acinetobacter haemolyticus]NAR63514.1 hypothetical protein [Acinetobacter haemolyticus]RSN74417.1 hypothetical protein EA769_13075 [Acinetobacter haemolyticus]
MCKKYLIILFCMFSLVSCSNLDSLTTVSVEQKTDARLLYRGFMYGNLEQIKRHTDEEFFEKIKETPQFLKDVKHLIPKTDNFKTETLSVNYSTNFPQIWKKKLIVTYIYYYDSKTILYKVVFDSKTKKIIDITLSEIVA